MAVLEFPVITWSSRMAAAFLLLLMSVGGSMSQQLCEQCNCHISTNKEGPQAIYNMGLVCNTGTVTWLAASGGVLLELSPFIHGNFRACFRTESDRNTYVKVSQEKSHVSGHKHFKFREEEPLEEGNVSFRLEHLFTSKSRSKEFCIDSRTKEPLLLYIEAYKKPGVGGVSKVLIHYDMEKLDSNLPLNTMDDCRPCTKEELLDAYCSMDFVVVGSMAEVRANSDNEKSDIVVNVKQIIHQTTPTFFKRVRRSDRHLTGTLVVPRKCHIQKDAGEFLLSGRMRLGNLALKCAPYLHDWQQIQQEAECSHG